MPGTHFCFTEGGMRSRGGDAIIFTGPGNHGGAPDQCLLHDSSFITISLFCF